MSAESHLHLRSFARGGGAEQSVSTSKFHEMVQKIANQVKICGKKKKCWKLYKKHMRQIQFTRRAILQIEESRFKNNE